MDPATISSSEAGNLLTFTVKETTGNDVPGTVVMNEANTAATFTPTLSALHPNTNYTAAVTMAAKNAAGVAMANPIEWTFTTDGVERTGQTPVNLGKAGPFAILTKSGITDVYPSAINGDVGSSPITGAAIHLRCVEMATGRIYSVNAAGPLPCRVTDPKLLTVAIGDKWSTRVLISTDVTISGGPNDVWIFQIAGTLTQASATKVILKGGARSKNIFWQTSGAVAIGTTANFEGVILAKTKIAMKTGASANGRLLAQTAVTLEENAVTRPGAR
jgi:hypothetical protein